MPEPALSPQGEPAAVAEAFVRVDWVSATFAVECSLDQSCPTATTVYALLLCRMMTTRALCRRLLNRLPRRRGAVWNVCPPDGRSDLLGKGRRWRSLWPGHSEWAAAVATESRLALVQITALAAFPISRHLLPPRTVLYHPSLTPARQDGAPVRTAYPAPGCPPAHPHFSAESAESSYCALKATHQLTARFGRPVAPRDHKRGEPGKSGLKCTDRYSTM